MDGNLNVYEQPFQGYACRSTSPTFDDEALSQLDRRGDGSFHTRHDWKLIVEQFFCKRL
jgi:hypothetical protein